METDTLGNAVIIRNTGMEYTDGPMEMYFTESTNKVINMVKDITGGQMEMNIGESSKMTRNGGREYFKRRDYSTKTHMKKTSASAGVK